MLLDLWPSVPSVAHDKVSSFSSTSLRTSKFSGRPKESRKFNAKLIILSEENRLLNACVHVRACVRVRAHRKLN